MMLEQKGAAEAASTDAAALLEKVIVGGDLSKLSPAERMAYYSRVCDSLSLNPLTQPFAYVNLRGRGLTLYALKTATDQLRKIHGVSITHLDVAYRDDLVIVTVTATDRSGRTDTDVGVVALGNLRGEERANAVLKSVTKAKRRVTLSICGLGMLDETEVETIPGAEVVLCEEPQQTTGLTERPAPTRGGTAGTEPAAAAPSRNAAEWTPQQLGAAIRERAGTQTQLRTLADWQTLARTYGVPAPAAAKDMTQDWLLSLYQALCAKDYEERLGVASGEKEVRDILAHALTDRDRRLISSEHYTRLYDVAERRYAELSGPLTAHKHAS